ncbi:nuclear transport factor 2 family protein [Vogesella mureinivorans]|jgi:predicted SnoaL-like aldol condensation-catalyzing enzyme|uniref:nuclear transport factor 2 family protein n=1 Tax=Vogesella mureinivorans TaxID=657276 RepID=UPI0011C838E9|nr:nuclear transport factor 2 family protein [Vogesella mureinivorans]
MKRLLIAATLAAGLASAAQPALAGPREDANKALVLAFYDAAFSKLDAEQAATYLAPGYIQHNPEVANGIAPLQDYVRWIRANTPQSRASIKRVLADGDLVMLHVHSQDKPGERGVAVVDIFRVADGKIAEHWDVIQPVPAQDANGNGMF